MLDSDTLSPSVRVGRTALQAALGVAPEDALTHVLETHGSACDIDRWTAWCQYHNVIPSLYRVLSSHPHPAAQALQQALAPQSRAIAAAGLLQAQALHEILEAFATHGIPVIPVKGIHLDVRAYGGPGQRKDGDHDLLVRPDQLSDAVAVLHELGYQYTDPSLPVEAWHSVPIHHGPPLIKHAGPMPSWVELHWDVLPDTEGLHWHDPEHLTADFWARSVSTTLMGTPIRELASEDDVLHLMLHAIRHLAQHTRGLTARLSMVEDLARRVQSLPELPWTTVAARAEALGRTSVLGPIKYLWTHVLGAEANSLFPDAFSVDTWPKRGWERRLLPTRHLLADPPPKSNERRAFHHEKGRCTLVHLLLLKEPRDRWQLLREDVVRPLCTVNDKDREVAPALPDAALLPVRWMRLGWRAVRG